LNPASVVSSAIIYRRQAWRRQARRHLSALRNGGGPSSQVLFFTNVYMHLHIIYKHMSHTHLCIHVYTCYICIGRGGGGILQMALRIVGRPSERGEQWCGFALGHTF
jgi:hypothetical protein